MNRRSEVMQGLGALVVLALVLIGLPLALWLAAGWPLPGGLPSFGEVQDALARNRISDTFLVDALAVLGWIAWAQFALCVLVELAAAWRGRLPARVPAAGLNQAVARRLVAAALLLSSSAPGLVRTASLVPGPFTPGGYGPPPAVRTLGQGLAAAHAAEAPGAFGKAASAPAVHQLSRRQSVAEDDDRPVYEVQPKRPGHPRDTLWRIAEVHLGDPLRWRELWRLNRGRQQPDGRSMTDPDWIYPGWSLRMPPDAVGLPARVPAGKGAGEGGSGAEASGGSSARTAPEAAPEAEAGEGAAPPVAAAPPATAPEATEPPATRAPAAAAPATRAPATEAPSTEPPATTQPPATTKAPPTTRPPASTTPPATAPVTAPAPRPEPAGRPGGWDGFDGLDGLGDAALVGGLLGAGGLAAAGVAASLARLRRAQQQQRPRGARIHLPGPELAAAELAMRATQTPEAARFLERALGVLGDALRARSLTAPAVLAVELNGAWLDVLLAEPTSAPDGWAASPDGLRWHLDAAALAALEPARAGRHQRDKDEPAPAVQPLPGLVTLGSTDQGVLLVNLQAPGLIVLDGPAGPVRRVLDAIAVELGTRARAGRFDLLLVGFGGTGLAVLDRVQEAEALDELLEDLHHQADQAGAWEEPVVPVAPLPSDSAVPGSRPLAMLLVAQPASREELEALAALTRTGAFAVVAAGEPTVPYQGAGWTVAVSDDSVDVHPLGLRLRPPRTPGGGAGAVGDLLRVAADRRPLPPQPDGAPAETRARHPAPHEPLEALKAPTVELRVLGPIELWGVPIDERGKAAELIVFLALRPEGADEVQLETALWPDRPPGTSDLAGTLATARDALGVAPDGYPCLLRDGEGRWHLHPGIRLDWSRFKTLAAYAHPGPEGAAVLRAALDLVRGQPFDGAELRAYGWVEVHHRPMMEAFVVDVAEDLARRCLQFGDPAAAAWAARRGLLASPTDERLYRILVLSADAAGETGTASSAVEELGHRLKPFDVEPDEQTKDLFRRLGYGGGRLGPAAT
jgi:DNA-binding SARP family transcriptional activator